MLWLSLLVKLLRFWICWEKTAWHFLKPAGSISWRLMETLFTFLPYFVLFWDCFYCTTPKSWLHFKMRLRKSEWNSGLCSDLGYTPTWECTFWDAGSAWVLQLEAWGKFLPAGSAQHGVTCEALLFVVDDFLYVNVLFSNNTCMIWHQKPSPLCAVWRLK